MFYGAVMQVESNNSFYRLYKINLVSDKKDTISLNEPFLLVI